MQTTKEAVIVAAVHTHANSFKKIKIIIKAILCCSVDLLTQGDIVMSFYV